MVSSRTVEVGSGLLPHGFFSDPFTCTLGKGNSRTVALSVQLLHGVPYPEVCVALSSMAQERDKSPTCDARRLIELDRRINGIHADVGRENGPNGTAVRRLSNVGHLMSSRYEYMNRHHFFVLRRPAMPPLNRLQLARTI